MGQMGANTIFTIYMVNAADTAGIDMSVGYHLDLLYQDFGQMFLDDMGWKGWEM